MDHNPRTAISNRIIDSGLVAIIRADSREGLIDTCRALRDGGITVAEITMTTPGALEAIAAARKTFGNDYLIGVGSVLDGDTARRAIDAGAEFVVSPVCREDVIEASHELGKPVMPGCFTPTEIYHATALGADLIKVFPANHLGPKYFKDILAPMPQLKLTPTGGVDLTTAIDWFAAGAKALGCGSALVKKDMIKSKNWKGLTDLAAQFVAKVKEARG
ncbi:MAG: bifunctional 4-hydroxy-2-oxoglutarate aldolase/2-dehydro-3-deoxy-phosphogluconate aldolase [Phycisphaeraceae bacterium]|nr:bifunctional 4-hydroxy-2-oxoglutarate aldolase/2-dehydro-3-deoxy-phosphogluconate aldolase [Phycisphaeraceae bacterium]